MELAPLETRRQHPRVRAGFPVRIQLGDRAVTVRARDISMTGLLLNSPMDLPERIPLRIPLPGLSREASATGRVERRDEHGVAISFSRIEWDDLLLLARYLAGRL